MSISQPQNRLVCVPRIIACDGREDAGALAQAERANAAKAILLPARMEVLAFVNEGVATFQCASLPLVSDVLVGLGFCESAVETVDYLASSANSYIMEKPLNGGEISIRPLRN